MNMHWSDKWYPKHGVFGGWHHFKNGEKKPFFIRAEFRKDPIPRTGVRRHHIGAYYRHPKTTETLRDAANPEFKLYVRAKRKKCWVPDVWDDIPRYSIKDKSWKRYRKTQYKTVNMGPNGPIILLGMRHGKC